MQYTIREQAIKDMDEIWLYIKEQWSKEQANNYYKLLYSEILRLAEFPHLGKQCSYIVEGMRYSIIKSHFIFYSITSSGSIDVIRVLHENRDFLQLFDNKPD